MGGMAALCLMCVLCAYMDHMELVMARHWPSCLRFSRLFSVLAHKLYPVRVRLGNDVMKQEEWHTVAYIPVVRTEQESAAGERERLRWCGKLKRVLYLAFSSAICASHDGVELKRGGRTFLAFPRILQYICDKPEERFVLDFKAGLCGRPCSSCDALLSDIGGVRALRACDRAAIATLERQHQGFRFRWDRRFRERRLALEAVDSTNSVLPAIAAMAGLSIPPYMLFKTVGFDILHVRFVVVVCSALLTSALYNSAGREDG